MRAALLGVTVWYLATIFVNDAGIFLLLSLVPVARWCFYPLRKFPTDEAWHGRHISDHVARGDG